MNPPNHLKVEYVGPRSCVQSPKGPGDIDADAAEVLMEQQPPQAISSLLCTAAVLYSIPTFLGVMKMAKDLCIGEGARTFFRLKPYYEKMPDEIKNSLSTLFVGGAAGELMNLY